MPRRNFHLVRRLRRHSGLAVLIVILLAAFGLAAWHNQARYDSDQAQAVSGPSVQNYYKSLDLSQARQAVYTNQAISYVQDLGTVNGVKKVIISFKVPKDRLTEYGLMTLPDQPAPATGYPVIILCHGYANPSKYSTTKYYLSTMEFYSRHSFAVIKPDFRGQGLSIHAGQPDGAFYSMAYNTDALSLIAAIKQTSYLDKNDISVWGHSMGGYIALRAAVVSPDIKNVILLSAPVGTVRDMFSQYTAVSDLSNPTAHNIKNYELHLHGNPYSNPGYWAKVSPLNYLNDTQAFIEINVGTADRVVPPHFSADLNSALTRLHKPHQYFIYQGGTHGLVPQRPLIEQRSLKVLEATPL